MLKVRLPRQKLLIAAVYYAENNEGLCPVIESDDDLVEWALRIFDGEVDEAEFPTITIKGEDATIAGNKKVMEAVERHILD